MEPELRCVRSPWMRKPLPSKSMAAFALGAGGNIDSAAAATGERPPHAATHKTRERATEDLGIESTWVLGRGSPQEFTYPAVGG